MDRYDADGAVEEECQPGSNGKVLNNLYGIIDPEEMEEAESGALFDAIQWSIDHFPTDQEFDFDSVREMHRRWLGDVYGFAGQLRTVNLSKGGFMFATASYLENSVKELAKVLRENTPCEGVDQKECVARIAKVHAELLIVHPFREGNGRLARWLADLMALQADLPMLDWNFETDVEETRERYFAALRKGYAGRLDELKEVIDEAITRSLNFS